jgi:hypothetical protein
MMPTLAWLQNLFLGHDYQKSFFLFGGVLGAFSFKVSEKCNFGKGIKNAELRSVFRSVE